ncbi:MAG: hypothetical protein ACOX1N_04585 [Candidatus Methanomethylophilaceae archaeon]
MSFFDNPKNFGLAAIVIGAVSMLAGIVGIVKGVLADPIATGIVVAAVGTILYGVLILGVGLPVYKGEESDKLTILGMFVRFVGLATIVVGVFTGAGQIIDDSLAVGVTTIVIQAVLGLVLIWIAGRIVDGSVDTLDRIVWIILLVVFAILTVFALVGIFIPFFAELAVLDLLVEVVLSLCQFILYAFLLVSVLSNEVKSAMGM